MESTIHCDNCVILTLHASILQIARAYQAAMQQFKAKMLKDGLTAAEADKFISQARANGSITSVQGAAGAYAARNQAIAAKLARMEAEGEQQWQQAHPPKPAFDPAKWKQGNYAESARWEAQQAYQDYRAGEMEEHISPPPACTAENIEPPKSAGSSESRPCRNPVRGAGLLRG